MRVPGWAGLGLLIAAMSCASTPDPPPLDRAAIRSIESGVTTRAQIDAWFGAPTDEEIRPGGVVCRYERWFRELERPGPVRSAVCASLAAFPIVRFPLYGSRACSQVDRREELEVRFSSEQIVMAVELEEEVNPAPESNRQPVGIPRPGSPPVSSHRDSSLVLAAAAE